MHHAHIPIHSKPVMEFLDILDESPFTLRQVRGLSCEDLLKGLLVEVEVKSLALYWFPQTTRSRI